MIVLDASAAVELLLALPASHAVEEQLRRHLHEGIHAPHLIDAEVGQVLRREVLRGDLSRRRAELALRHLGELPLRRHPHLPLAGLAFGVAANLTFYDALYVALARALGAELLTTDRRLARAAARYVRSVVVEAG